MEVKVREFLGPTVYWGKCSALLPGEESTAIHQTGGWERSRICLDVVPKNPCRKSSYIQHYVLLPTLQNNYKNKALSNTSQREDHMDLPKVETKYFY